MAAFTPFNYDEDIGKESVMIVCSYGPDNDTAIREIESWSRANGYMRDGELALNARRNLSGHKYFYSSCYLAEKAYGDGENRAMTPKSFGGREKNGTPSSSATLMRERTAERGMKLYEQHIRPKLGDGDFGKYVAMDVDVNHTLDYEIGEDQLATAERIFARRPDAILYTIRIGYPAVVTMRHRHTRRSA